MGGRYQFLDPFDIAEGAERQPVEQLAHRPPCRRNLHVGDQVGERLKDEAPLGEARMGEGDLGAIGDPLAEPEQIEIERARSPALFASPPADRAFDRLAERQDRLGIQGRPGDERAVQVVRLGNRRDRGRTVDRRHPDIEKVGAQNAKGPVEVLFDGPEVATEGERDERVTPRRRRYPLLRRRCRGRLRPILHR